MRPYPMSPEQAQVASVLLATRIAGVNYWCLEVEPFIGHASDGTDVHEVIAVDLALSNGMLLRITWAQLGEREGLFLEMDPVGAPGLVAARVTASEMPPWVDLIGEELIEIRMASQQAADGKLLWSLGADFAGGKSVTVALGEVTESGVAYVPDSLVVLHGEEAPSEYRVQSATTSAFGEHWMPTSDR